MDHTTKDVLAIVLAIVGVSTLAVVVSKQAETANVVKSLGNALSGVLKAATGPVSGTQNSGNLLPNLNGG